MESIKCQEKGRSIMSDYTVYIDEAGDLGIGRGTRWFVLSAVIVAKEDESAIREKMRQIKNRLNVREIHLRKISEFPKRAFIVRELNSQNYTYINILVDTTKFDKAKIPDPLKAYNYVCKYLLERVSLFLEERGKVADIMLSARGTSRDGDLIKYIKEKLLPYEKNSINSAVFNKITARGAGEWELLYKTFEAALHQNVTEEQIDRLSDIMDYLQYDEMKDFWNGNKTTDFRREFTWFVDTYCHGEIEFKRED